MSWSSNYCARCRRFRPVPGQGPKPSKVMFIGEGPGQEEDGRLKPFIGKSGKELDGQYLLSAGLCRDEVYVTNAIKCRQGADDGDKPYPADIECCSKRWLPEELGEVKPDLVVTLGAVALRLFGDHSLELVHGRPLYGQRFGDWWEGTVFPIYHPAAGLRQAEIMIDLQADFKALWDLRHGKLVVPEDEYPDPQYRELETPEQLWTVLAFHGGGGPAPWLECAIDTETDIGRFWCLSFSLTPGTGYMVRDRRTVAAFGDWLKRVNPLVIYHNYLFDAAVLGQVGIVTPRFTDTMVEAYNMGGQIPQALKVAAYRLCGMVMTDYGGVVMPYAVNEAIEYLELASRTVDAGYIERLPYKPKIKLCRGAAKYGGKHEKAELLFTEPGEQGCYRCTRVIESGKMAKDKGGTTFPWDRANRILEDVLTKGASPLDRWNLLPYSLTRVIEETIGPMPKPSIAQVPLAEAIPYACRDADATKRLKHAIRREAAKMVREVGRAVA